MAITKYKNERQKTAKTKAKNERIKKYKKFAKTYTKVATGQWTEAAQELLSYRKGNSKSDKEGK